MMERMKRMKRIKKTEKTQNTVIAGLTRNLLPMTARILMGLRVIPAMTRFGIVIATLFLFLPCTGAIAQAQVQASSLPSGRLLSGQLPSTNYLQAATLANIPSPGITVAGRELLYGPPTLPPTEGDGGGPAVGEAPVTDVLWLLILCCLMYALFLMPFPASLQVSPGRTSGSPPKKGGRGVFTLLSGKLSEARERSD
jgi:hypothetical protein